jgi:large conductance mechanosensitive channel
MFKEFKEFALSKTLIDVAVGLIMALALKELIQALVEWILMPIVGAIFGKPDFTQLWVVTINDSQMHIGTFVTAFITFLGVAAGVFFFIVRPYKAHQARLEAGDEAPPEPSDEIKLLSEIRDSLKR